MKYTRENPPPDPPEPKQYPVSCRDGMPKVHICVGGTGIQMQRSGKAGPGVPAVPGLREYWERFDSVWQPFA